MADIELSLKERLFLSIQLRILEKLSPDEAESLATWRKAIDEGYSLHYGDFDGWILDELDKEGCREVLDILEMHSRLLDGYNQLKDKTGIDPDKLKFLGFDGNDEGQYLGYAQYFIRDKDRYNELKDAGDGLNSHGPFLQVYRRMLKVWRPLKDKYPLSKDDIQAIIAARPHPGN